MAVRWLLQAAELCHGSALGGRGSEVWDVCREGDRELLGGLAVTLHSHLCSPWKSLPEGGLGSQSLRKALPALPAHCRPRAG